MAEKAKEKETKAVAPWRPLSEMTRWQREMERMFDDFFGRRWEPFRVARWLPSGVGVSPPSVELDVYEEKEEIVAKAEVPGLEKEDIEVSIADSTLTIKGEKKKEEEVKEEDYYRLELSYGSFVRSVELPREVQTDKVKATFKNGVLEIRMPKSEEAKKKEIKVKVD
jgi:HSP20 family protein